MCGESNDCADTLEWEKDVLQHFLTEYEAKDIINADETTLFYKSVPARTYAFVGETVTSSKTPKDRPTLMPCANMTGTKKLSHMVIGKVKQPTALKQVSIHELICVLIDSLHSLGQWHVLYCISLQVHIKLLE